MKMPEAFDHHYDHKVTREEAAEMVHAHSRKPVHAGELKSVLFGRKAFERILEQKDCKGIRIYMGRHGNGMPTMVMIGVDEHGQDLPHPDTQCSENTRPCPPFCHGSSLA